MSTSDPVGVNPNPPHGTTSDPEAHVDPGQASHIPTTPPRPKSSQKKGPDTITRKNHLSTQEYRSASLPQARRILLREVGHTIGLPIDHLWKSYSPKEEHLHQVKNHLDQKNLLREGRWLFPDRFTVKLGGSERTAFSVLPNIFNKVLVSLQVWRDLEAF